MASRFSPQERKRDDRNGLADRTARGRVMSRAYPVARGGVVLSPEIARLITAIARDLAREDHERESSAYNGGPALASPVALGAD
jgi:hypothetical protein